MLAAIKNQEPRALAE